MNLSLKSIESATGGTLYGKDLCISNVSIDSRTVKEGGLYVAICGDRFDGHSFLEAAKENGAVAFLVAKKPQNENIPYILVKDTRLAFLALASYYRQSFPNLFVVGLTGSVGKTTTKEMIWAVLSEAYPTLKTEGNLNNEIGMPKTLLRLTEETEAAVIEMGMSNFNEIDRMTRSALPNLAVITNIGTSHIEFLGSREGILKAKTEIFNGMQKGSTAFLNGDDDKLWNYQNPDYKLEYFAIDNAKAKIRATEIKTVGDTTEFTVLYPNGKQKVILNTIGKHNVYDALAAFSVGLYQNMAPEKIAEGLFKYQTVGLRQKMEHVGSVTFIADCYNASLDSQKASLSVLSSLPNPRKIAVLGDMLELGDFSKSAHEAVGTFAAEMKIDALYCYGKAAKDMYLTAKDTIPAYYFTEKKDLTDALKKELKTGDAVLFKASRGMKIEEVLDVLMKEWVDHE